MSKVLDRKILQHLKDIAMDRFATILGLYVEEGEKYIAQIDLCIKAGDMDGIIIAAHNLKSASAQIGALSVHEIVKNIEAKAMEIEKNKNPVDGAFAADLQNMKREFAAAKTELEEILRS